MLAPLALALCQVQVQQFPNAVMPSGLRRMGKEVAFRQDSAPNFAIGTIVEGQSSTDVLDADADPQFGVNFVVWQGRFVYGNPSYGLRAVGVEGEVPIELVSPQLASQVDLFNGLTVAGDRLFLNARTVAAAGLASGYELWTFDTPGIDPVRIPLGDTSQPASAPTAFGDSLFFVKPDPGFGQEPWISDGTQAGTRRLVDLWPGEMSGTVSGEPSVFDGERVWFYGATPDTGRELWVTDGTAAGTQLAADVVPGPGDSRPRNFTLFGDRIAFQVFIQGQDEIWSMPRAGGLAEPVSGIPLNSALLPVDALGAPIEDLYFSTAVPGSSEPQNILWRWRGPGTAVEQLTSPEPLLALGSTFVQVASDGTVLFSGRTDAAGVELYRVGGPLAGIEQIIDLEPGPVGSNPSDMVLAGNRVLWRAKVAGTPTLHGLDVGELALSSIHELGTSCDGAARLGGAGLPTPGAAISLDLSGGTPGTLGALLLGRDLLPAPALGDCGAAINATQILGLLTLDATGAASLPLVVPAVPALTGIVYRAQHFEAAPGGPVLGAFRSTNVAEIIIGG